MDSSLLVTIFHHIEIICSPTIEAPLVDPKGGKVGVKGVFKVFYRGIGFAPISLV